MRGAILLAGVGGIAMAIALVYGFGLGNGWAEVRELVHYPWFNVSLVDVYVGFALFGGWIVARERSRLVAGAWIALLLVLGNLIACLYVFRVVLDARGDADRFWRGDRSAG